MPKKANYSRPIKEMGFLQPNKRQINASSPDYTGEIVVDDVPYRISLWNEAKDHKSVAVVPNGAGIMSAEQEPVEEPVDVMPMRLQGEVEQLREHVIYISQAVRSLVTIVIRDEDDAVH